MDLGLRDKVVLITGASGGIGRALSEVFGEEGARLVLVSRSRPERVESWIAERGVEDRALACRADVRKLDELEAAFAAARERFGRVDACIANAGVWPPGDQGLWEVDPERVRLAVETNLYGSAWTARAFLRSLSLTGPRPDEHGASLVFIGSTAGRFGERGHADYAMAKAGLVGLVRTLKNEIPELDPWGRVNLIEPGWTVTDMAREALNDDAAVGRIVRTMPLQQLGRAVDVARTAALLTSPAASRHTTGQTITVAGGMEGRSLWEQKDIDLDRLRGRLHDENP